MKKQSKGKVNKIIGKNCQNNQQIEYKSYKKGFPLKTKTKHICSINKKRCGPHTTCNCFDDKGKLCFQTKEKS